METPSKRVRAGFSLAIEALVIIFGSLLLSKKDGLHVYVLPILLGFSLGGVGLLVWGRLRSHSAERREERSPDTKDIDTEQPLAFLASFAYWGWVILISILPIAFLCHLLVPPAETVDCRPRARVAARVALPPEPVIVRQVKFPDLKLTGLVFNGTNSTAVLNGSTVSVGRRLEDITLLKVERWGVIVEMNGVQKMVRFDN